MPMPIARNVIQANDAATNSTAVAFSPVVADVRSSLVVVFDTSVVLVILSSSALLKRAKSNKDRQCRPMSSITSEKANKRKKKETRESK